MTVSHESDGNQRPDAQQQDGMDAHQQQHHEHRRQGDPALDLLHQVDRIALGLGHLRVHLATLPIPPDCRDFIYDHASEAGESLRVAQEEIGILQLNLIDDLSGTSAIDEHRRVQLDAPPARRVERMRETMGYLLEELQALRFTGDAETDDLEESLNESASALRDLKAQIEGIGDADDDGEEVEA